MGQNCQRDRVGTLANVFFNRLYGAVGLYWDDDVKGEWSAISE